MLSFVEGHHMLNKHIQIFWDINVEQNIINFKEEKYSKRRISYPFLHILNFCEQELILIDL